MKSKLLIILLFASVVSFGQSVPNTTTFSLQNVVDVVNPTTDDLSDCFTDANTNYFSSLYSGSKNSLLNFRDYGPHNATPFTYTANGNFTAINSNPISCSITISAGTNLLIVTIHAVVSASGTRGDTGIPTFNGVNMTQVGNYAGTYPTEVWYLVNPSIGTYNVIIPNSASNNLQVSTPRFNCPGTLSVYSYASSSATTTNPTTTTTTANGNISLFIQSTTLKINAPYNIGYISESDIGYNDGIGGASFGSLGQYAIQTTDGTDKTMNYVLDEALKCYSIIINFKSQ